MEALQQLFNNLTPAQAELLSSGVTLMSALLVAIIAPLTFHLVARGGVKDFRQAVTDLKEAADSAKTQSSTIRDSMGTVRGVATQVTDLGVLIASVQEALANTQNTLLESRPEAAENGQTEGPRDRIKNLWRGLQEMVERIASRPSINGNTRARYARIDRRGYLNLIEALLTDRHLAGSLDDWRSAYHQWTGALRGAAEPTAEDVQCMERLERTLRDANASGDGADMTLQQPTLSPGVMMTPRNVEAESPRSHARAAFANAPTIDQPDRRRTEDGRDERPPA